MDFAVKLFVKCPCVRESTFISRLIRSVRNWERRVAMWRWLSGAKWQRNPFATRKTPGEMHVECSKEGSLLPAPDTHVLAYTLHAHRRDTFRQTDGQRDARADWETHTLLRTCTVSWEERRWGGGDFRAFTARAGVRLSEPRTAHMKRTGGGGGDWCSRPGVGLKHFTKPPLCVSLWTFLPFFYDIIGFRSIQAFILHYFSFCSWFWF